MQEGVTLNERDQRRVRTLNRVLEGTVTAVDAAEQLGLSERQVRRILAAYRKEGAAAIPHHNRGRPPKHALAAVIRQRVVALSRTVYAETNDRHFRDLLAEREGIVLSRIASGGRGGRRPGCCCRSMAARTTGWTAAVPG